MTKTMALVLAIVLFGSLVGLFDLVGHDTLKAAGVGTKSPYLVAGVFFVLIVARVLYNRPGSTFAMGVVAGLFKLAGFIVLGKDMWVCQCGAVAIQAGALDLFISLAASRWSFGLRVLMPAAVVACAISYLAFVGMAAALSDAGRFADSSFVAQYLSTRLAIALPMALLAAPIAFFVGRALRAPFSRLESRPLRYVSVTAAVAAVAIAVLVVDLAR